MTFSLNYFFKCQKIKEITREGNYKNWWKPRSQSTIAKHAFNN
jgi:hypothetical protein